MSVRTEKNVADFAKWWRDNATRTKEDGNVYTNYPEDPVKAGMLAIDAVEALMNIYIDIIEDIRVLEGRGPVARNVSKIITPDNVLKRNNGH